MTENIIARPVWSNAIKGKRAETWFFRYRSAWDMAALVCGENVTETEYNAALKLLDSVQRYALADAREWEMENNSERYCNSVYHKERIKQLDARRARLQKALARYGVKMENYGLYPSIIKIDTKQDCYFLHYFD